MPIPNLNLKRFIGSQGQSHPQLIFFFFMDVCCPLCCLWSYLRIPCCLGGALHWHQGYNQIISPFFFTGGWMQTTCRGCHWNYLLQLDERGGHTWHTGTGICSHTHTPLQLMPTAKLSSKSLQGFSSADLLSGGHRELLPRALPCREAGKTSTEHLDRVGRTGRLDREKSPWEPGAEPWQSQHSAKS